jgi:hypothetical protein
VRFGVIAGGDNRSGKWWGKGTAWGGCDNSVRRAFCHGGHREEDEGDEHVGKHARFEAITWTCCVA